MQLLYGIRLFLASCVKRRNKKEEKERRRNEKEKWKLKRNIETSRIILQRKEIKVKKKMSKKEEKSREEIEIKKNPV